MDRRQPEQTREQRHSATGEQRAAFLRGLGDDLIAEAARSMTDVIVVDYMQPQALSAAEVLSTPTVAYVHTLYQRVAVGESTPMAMAGSTDGINRLRAEFGLDPVPTLPALLDRCDRVLVVTSDELDRPDVPLPSNVRYVGPIVENAGPDLTWAPPWPANEKPLVHMSMGTVPPDDLVLPLVQQALDALDPLDVHTFVTLAGRPQRPWQGATDPDVQSLRIPENAAVAPYVRHAAVLPHTDLFITHAGLSSIGAALTYGVPMVCTPIFNEQPDNAAHVEALGAGRVVQSGATVDELRAVVTEVLEEPRFREVIRRIANRLREAGNGRPGGPRTRKPPLISARGCQRAYCPRSAGGARDAPFSCRSWLPCDQSSERSICTAEGQAVAGDRPVVERDSSVRRTRVGIRWLGRPQSRRLPPMGAELQDAEVATELLTALGVSSLSAEDAEMVDASGYLVVPSVLSADEITPIQQSIADLEVTMPRTDPTWRPRATRHLDGLIGVGATFDRAWMSPRLLSAAAHLLGPSLWVASVGLRAPIRGHGLQELHRGYVPRPSALRHDSATAIVALVDVPSDGGATRVVPGSHSQHVVADEPQSVPLRAGDALIFSELVLHSGTTNHRAQRRDALVVRYYRRGQLPQHFSSTVDTRTADRLGDLALLLIP